MQVATQRRFVRFDLLRKPADGIGRIGRVGGGRAHDATAKEMTGRGCGERIRGGPEDPVRPRETRGTAKIELAVKTI
jgi:hypothetical protein